MCVFRLNSSNVNNIQTRCLFSFQELSAWGDKEHQRDRINANSETRFTSIPGTLSVESNKQLDKETPRDQDGVASFVFGYLAV